jgi:hypothetical protein
MAFSGLVRPRKGSKLTPDDVHVIRASSEPHRVLAERYGVSRSHISGLKAGRFWTVLEREATP